MREFRGVRQENTGFRRMFTGSELELYVWYVEQGGDILGFQLVYPISNGRKAFTWTAREGFSHLIIDGWDNNANAGSPFMVSDGTAINESILSLLRTEIENVEEPIRFMVLEKVEEFQKRS